MGFLANKRILITGMISTRSIAYGIAQSMHREGACLAFTYQGERVRERVLGLAKEFDSDLVFQCDVANDADIGKLLGYNEKHAPLKRNVTVEEVGNAAAFLCSDLASGITGEITYVDGGFNTTSLGSTEE